MPDCKTAEEAFQALKENGFDFGYVKSIKGVLWPAETAENFLANGWLPKGGKVVFLGSGGHEHERNKGFDELGVGNTFTIKKTKIGGVSSSYEFEEVDGSWNTVMFAKEVK